MKKGDAIYFKKWFTIFFSPNIFIIIQVWHLVFERALIFYLKIIGLGMF